MNKGKAKAKASASTGKAKAQPAAPPQGRKRKPCVQDEWTRLTWRVRLSDGSSKGFRYTADTKEAVRQEAEKFLEASSE